MLSPGQQLGPYEIRGLLGKGGMGEVYLARDPRLGRDLALKVLPSHAVGDDVALERFMREARTTSALCPSDSSTHTRSPDGRIALKRRGGEGAATNVERLGASFGAGASRTLASGAVGVADDPRQAARAATRTGAVSRTPRA